MNNQQVSIQAGNTIITSRSRNMKNQFQTPSPRGIISQRNKVNTFRELFLNNLDSPHVEIYRMGESKSEIIRDASCHSFLQGGGVS